MKAAAKLVKSLLNKKLFRTFVPMKRELSILIPVYNTVCTSIVGILLQQCQHLADESGSFDYEILVADDGSSQQSCIEANRAINKLSHCQLIEKKENTGSAATRNFLAEKSHYQWLLFLDSDMDIISPNFIADYMKQEGKGVINGGIRIGDGSPTNLRFLYEKHSEPKHTAEKRSQKPYHYFRSTNFMIERQLMLSCPFDERFKKSGYEDVLFGKQLKQRRAPISHIENPTLMTDFEPNPNYVAKIERSLRTLHQFRNELQGFSQILTFDKGIHLSIVRNTLILCHKTFGKLARRNLCGNHPNLQIFNLYRLGYYLSLTKKDSQL